MLEISMGIMRLLLAAGRSKRDFEVGEERSRTPAMMVVLGR